MDVTPVRMWASPSTLHLKVAITPKGASWVQFSEMHISLDDLVEVIREGQRVIDMVTGSLSEQLALPYTDQHSQAQDG